MVEHLHEGPVEASVRVHVIVIVGKDRFENSYVQNGICLGAGEFYAEEAAELVMQTVNNAQCVEGVQTRPCGPCV